MAVQTIYLLGTAGSAPNYFGSTQLNGSAPTAANTAFGWTPSRTAISTPYYRGYLGATAASTAAQAASYNASTAGPTPGTGTSATTAGDSFVCGPFFGTFANTAWTFAFNLRAGTAGCVGHVNLRVWRSVNASGSNAAQVLANTAGATVTLSTTADVNSSVSWSPGALTLNQEYLFFQLEWQETTASGTNNSNVFFRVGTAAITTPDYQATPCTGTLAVTETGDTIAGTASTNLAYGRGGFGVGAYNGPTQGATSITGTLALTQAAQALSGTGSVSYPTITGTLGVTQASHTIVSAGAVTVRGTLGVTQANEAVAAAGTVSLAGTLGLTQQAQTLAAAGGVGVVGTLSAPQAAQTLAATAGPVVGGTLPGGAVGTTWNPSDLVATTLSNGNLTATPTGQGGVRSIASVSAGKYYFEVTFGATGTRTSTAAGIANAAAAMSGVIVNVTGAAICNGAGAVGVNNTTALANLGAFGANGVCCIALDKGGNLIWFRNGAAGNWNASGTANPATGAGGFSVSGLTGGVAALYAYEGATTSAGSPNTANFGDSVFSGAVPAGFAAGFPGTVAAMQANETLSGSGVVLSGIAGSVNLVQASQTVAAAGTVTGLVGNLAQTQASETLAATGGVTVRGTLSATQAAQTLSGTGAVFSVISGTLNRPQAAQTLSAAGTVVYPVIIGQLGAVVGPPYGMGAYGVGAYGSGLLQVAQTLSAHGTVSNAARLTLAQADQAIAAAATVGPVTGAIAGVLQDDQTLTDGRASPLWATPAPCEFGVWTPQGMSIGYGVYNFGAGPFGGSTVVGSPLVQGGWLAPANCANGSWTTQKLAA